MTPRAVLVVAAAGLVAAAGACAHRSPDASGSADPSSTADHTAVPPDPTCRAELAELDRRDEAGEIDWEAIDGSDQELTDQELESVTIALDPYPGDVATGGERPTFPDFPDRLDIAMLSDVELAEAVDACYEVGLLAEGSDGATGDDEAG